MNYEQILEIENMIFSPNIYVYFVYNYRKIK